MPPTSSTPEPDCADPVPPGPTSGLRHQLLREWARLRHRPDALRRAEAWRLTVGPLRDLDEVLTAVGYRVPRTAANEAALRALVVVAGTDELAARVVLERLLPGLLAAVRRWRRRGAGDHAFEELLSALWISVRTFDPTRSPGCLAAALISDAEYRAFRAPRRRRSATERPIDPATIPLTTDDRTSSCDELAGLLALARESGVDADDLDLIRQLLSADSPHEVARRLRVTPRTVRNRRRRVTLRLRAVALAA